MTQNRSGFSSLAKRLFVGSVLGAVVALLYTPRSGVGIRSDISDEGVRFQIRGRPLSTTRIEKSFETGKRLKPTIGWLVIFVLASAVAVFSDLRLKKSQ